MNTVLMNGIVYGLEELEKDSWIRLLNGSLSYKHAMHNPVVANMHQQGVNMRTVVLRKAWPAEKKLAFHTDIRSGKWTELEQQKNISWLFYDAAGKIQIRLSGEASLHHKDTIADESWLASTMNSRKIYLGEKGPSQLSELAVSGLPAVFEQRDPTNEESIPGRKNFGVVVTDVHWMEWLWLNSGGHRRATFTYNEDKTFTAGWLIP